MIIVEIYEDQGLGNQLWVYATGVTIAKKLRVPFILIGYEKFKGQDFIKIPQELGLTKINADKVRLSRAWRVFKERLFYDPELEYFSSGYDVRVLNIKGITKLEGLFQSEKYLFDFESYLKKIIIVSEILLDKYKLSNDTCVLNLRGGEYKLHKNLILTKDYWINAINNMRKIYGINKFLIVTDDKKYAARLLPAFPQLAGGIGECYATLFNARYLVLSNSSFAYFPTKLGTKKDVVIAPKYWCRHTNILGRWASPCNLYRDWIWQSESGELYSYENISNEAIETEDYYLENYNVSSDYNSFHTRSIKELVPQPLRKLIKKLLSFIFPLHIG